MRSRHTFCAPLVALDLFEERWTLNIVYALLEGPLAFNALQRAVPSINQSVLKQRLDHLETLGLVTRTVHSLQPPRTSYDLTSAGGALCEVISAAVRWVKRYWPTRNTDSDGSAAEAVKILQQKWGLHIVNGLLQGARTYSELQGCIEGINHTVLAQRLELLESFGVLRKLVSPEAPARPTYELTEAGLAFRDVVEVITVWANRELKAPVPVSLHEDN